VETREGTVADEPLGPGETHRARWHDSQTGKSWTSVSYGAEAARPNSYPTDLPFIPSIAVFFTETEDGKRHLGWHVESRDELDRARAALLDSVKAEGVGHWYSLNPDSGGGSDRMP